MSRAKDKPVATNTKTLELKGKIGQTEGQVIAAAALAPAINAAYVVETYQDNIIGNGADFMALIDGLEQTTGKVKDGDLSHLEAMLIGQATALETIFTSLVKRAASQTLMAHYQTFFTLALKAQAQSRATISALVDLKYPRQATFVKQANIAHGPQQVNNGTQNDGTQAGTLSHAQESKPLQNELLEDASYGSTQLDTRATATPARSHPAVETVDQVHRAAKRTG